MTDEWKNENKNFKNDYQIDGNFYYQPQGLKVIEIDIFRVLQSGNDGGHGFRKSWRKNSSLAFSMCNAMLSCKIEE